MARIVPICTLALGLAAACSVEKPECAADRDCRAGEICLSGHCRPTSGFCTGDADCLAGQVCEGGICQSACSSALDCPDGTWCDAGHCLPGCQTDADCGPGTRCNPSLHECVPAACGSDTDCPDGMRCAEGLCEPCPGGDCGCSSDADCAAGERCIDGVCQAAPECTTDADCMAGFHCVDGRCRVPGCMSDADCASGEHCELGRCMEDVECSSDADCGQDEECVGGQCVPAGPECSSDADCPSGQHCLDESCTTAECLEDRHCGAGESCVGGICQGSSSCDLLSQDCPTGQKCTVDANGQPVCLPAGSGQQCRAGQADDCPAGMLCTGYGGAFDCHAICSSSTGAGCSTGYSCSPLDGLPGYGTCQCDPIQQGCPYGQRCSFDAGNTPVCLPAGDGSDCYTQGLDDCPAGTLCATAGVYYECHDICIYATDQGCPYGVYCYTVGDIPNWGVCVPDCHPLEQDCPSGYKCTIGESAPICDWNLGSGSQCLASISDDCPRGQMCAGDGSSYSCYDICNVHNGLGCSGGTCIGLLGVEHWGVCDRGR
ncbi:MAG: hypothetical protein JXR96_30355 [Deltaproteobacteria bacterium]|nr:hypothetical protein [Deltaproteobacteria bacterium]